MNTRIRIKLNDSIKNTDGGSISFSGEIVEDLFLAPLYARPEDVLPIYMDEPTAAMHSKALSIIFDTSILAKDKLSDSAFRKWNIDSAQAFRIRREFVICMSAYKFGKQFYRDYMKSIKKSKFFGDVKVSLDIEKDPGFIMQIMGDAKDCYESILEDITGSSSDMLSFSIGRTNPCSRSSNREWLSSSSPEYAGYPIAANMVSKFCRKYKVGFNS